MITEGKIGAYVIELSSFIKRHIHDSISSDIKYVNETINENKDNTKLIKFNISFIIGSGFSKGIWEFTRKHNIKLKQLSVQANIDSAGAVYDSGKLLLDKELINKFIDDVMEDMHIDSIINHDNDTVLELIMDSISFATSMPNFRQILSTTIHELEHLMQFKNGMNYDKVGKHIPMKNEDKLKEYYTKYCNNSWEISAFSNEYASKYIQENPDFTEEDITFLIQSALMELKKSYPRSDISTTNKKKFLKNVYGILRKYLDERPKDIITETKIGAYVHKLHQLLNDGLQKELEREAYYIHDRSNSLGYDRYTKSYIGMGIEDAIKYATFAFCKIHDIACDSINFVFEDGKTMAVMFKNKKMILNKKLYTQLIDNIFEELVIFCPSKTNKNYVEDEHTIENISNTMIDTCIDSKSIVNEICDTLIHELSHAIQFVNGMPTNKYNYNDTNAYLKSNGENDAHANEAAAKFILRYPKYDAYLVSSALRPFLSNYRFSGKDRERFIKKVYTVLMHHLEIKQE